MPSYLEGVSVGKQKKVKKPMHGKQSKSKEWVSEEQVTGFRTLKQLLEEVENTEITEQELDEPWAVAGLRMASELNAISLSIVNDISDLEIITDRSNKYELMSLVNIKLKAYKLTSETVIFLMSKQRVR